MLISKNYDADGNFVRQDTIFKYNILYCNRISFHNIILKAFLRNAFLGTYAIRLSIHYFLFF